MDACRKLDILLGDLEQEIAGGQVLLLVGGDALDGAVHGRRDDRLHLHGRQHDEGLALGHLVAVLDADRDDLAGHGRADGRLDALDGLFASSGSLKKTQKVSTKSMKKVTKNVRRRSSYQ